MKRSEAVQAVADEEYLENFVPGVITGERTTRLRMLQRDAEACTDCGCWKNRKQVLFGGGNPYANLMVVGDWPSAADDAAGDFFVEEVPTLDKMMKGIGLIDGDYYLCNTLKCLQFFSAAEDQVACGGFLHAQIEAVRPQVILALGLSAFSSLCGCAVESWGQTAGYRVEAGEYTVAVVACPHPREVAPGCGDETLRRGVGRALGVVKRLLGGTAT